MKNHRTDQSRRTFQHAMLRIFAAMAPIFLLGAAYADRIEITSFQLAPERLTLGESFQVRIVAQARGSVEIGSYVLRISHPVQKRDAPPNFSLYQNSRAYWPENNSLYLIDNGSVDIDPQPGAFAVSISTKDWKEGTHYFTIFAHNRPARGAHIKDFRNFSATVQEGVVILRDLIRAAGCNQNIFQSFQVSPDVVNPGDDFYIDIESGDHRISRWRLHHPYTIPEEEVLPGFHFDPSQQQAYYGPGGIIEDGGEQDLNKEAGKIRLKISAAGWRPGIHHLTIEPDAVGKGPYRDYDSDYRDFAVKVRSPKDRLSVKIEPSRYFGEGTHFNTMFVLSNGRVICDDQYSDDKGYTWQKYPNPNLKESNVHGHSVMMSYESTEGEAFGLAYRTFPVEGRKGVFVGKQCVSRDGGKTIEGPFDAVFHVPRAVKARGHAVHPGPLYMRSIVPIQDGSLLALMCGWFDADLKESPVHGQNYRRSFLCRSADSGKTWRYYSTIAYEPNWGSEGWNEGSLLALNQDTLIAALRSGSDSQAWKDNPLCLFYSRDQGKTWSPPHRSGVDGVYPSMLKMENGLLACSYGRPGAKIMFSADGGRTWTDHAAVHPERYSGYTWIVQVAPNELLCGFGVRNGLDPQTGQRKNMLRLTNIHVKEMD